MPIVKRHPRLEQILAQRCFFLFLALLALLVVMPYLVACLTGVYPVATTKP